MTRGGEDLALAFLPAIYGLALPAATLVFLVITLGLATSSVQRAM